MLSCAAASLPLASAEPPFSVIPLLKLQPGKDGSEQPTSPIVSAIASTMAANHLKPPVMDFFDIIPPCINVFHHMIKQYAKYSMFIRLIVEEYVHER
jgi:hypothetical protein